MDSELERDIAFLKKEKYHDQDHPDLEADIKRLKNGEPLAYVIGSIPFCGAHIDLSYRPLIPRPETEYWTEKLIAHLSTRENLRILDMCAGSGCIGIALLTHLPTAHVDFAEKDSLLGEQIWKNVALNSIDAKRVNIYTTDFFADIPKENTYDIIVTNPPYISPESTDVAESVTSWEPHEALFAENDGYVFLEHIFMHSSNHLRTQGLLVCEFDPHQVPALKHYATEAGFLIRVYPDQYGVDRWCIATRSKEVYSDLDV